jgi:hypothetical protein
VLSGETAANFLTRRAEQERSENRIARYRRQGNIPGAGEKIESLQCFETAMSEAGDSVSLDAASSASAQEEENNARDSLTPTAADEADHQLLRIGDFVRVSHV